MECLNPKYVAKNDVTVPCGKCGFCLATRKSDWSTRINVEWRHCGGAGCFVTLTYADPHLHWLSGKSQLVKEHLQQFFKDLRKAHQVFRYYAVGEYGSKTFRPHYHVLFFGDVSEEVIRKKWKYGMVHIGRVNIKTVAYTLKYMITSKARGMKNGRSKPFATMSRRPGLGFSYITPSMVAWHKSGLKNYCIQDGETRHLPRYYKERIFSRLDRVKMSFRDARKAIEVERKKLYKLSFMFQRMRGRTVSQACVMAYNYYQEQRREAAANIIRSNHKNLQL